MSRAISAVGRRGRPLVTAAIVVILAAAGTACSKVNKVDKLGYKPVTLDVDEARTKTKTLSSQIFDLIGIRNGATTRPGPSVSTCAEDPEHLYRVRHTWSVYGVSLDTLSQGFQTARGGLPDNGWKITEYGPDTSQSKDLRIFANSTKEQYTARIELFDGTKPGNPPSAGKESGIMVTLVSACFRAPEGTDLGAEY